MSSDFDCRIIRSKRKTLSMEVTAEGDLVIRAPLKLPEKEIYAFVEKNKRWAADKIEAAKKKKETPVVPLTWEEIEELGKAALDYIPMQVAHYAALMDIDFGNVTIRNQTTRWGSCSSKKNLNFNVLLMLAPKEVIDSVIIHELCHRLYLDHSKNFWSAVKKFCPNYKTLRSDLKKQGKILLSKI